MIRRTHNPRTRRGPLATDTRKRKLAGHRRAKLVRNRWPSRRKPR